MKNGKKSKYSQPSGVLSLSPDSQTSRNLIINTVFLLHLFFRLSFSWDSDNRDSWWLSLCLADMAGCGPGRLWLPVRGSVVEEEPNLAVAVGLAASLQQARHSLRRSQLRQGSYPGPGPPYAPGWPEKGKKRVSERLNLYQWPLLWEVCLPSQKAENQTSSLPSCF